MKPRKDETAFDFLDRVVGWLKYENCEILETLPTTDAILDYAALWSTYDTDFLAGIEHRPKS